MEMLAKDEGLLETSTVSKSSIEDCKFEIQTIRNGMEQNGLRIVENVEHLKKSTNSIGSNYYWLVTLVVFALIFYLQT